MRIGTRGSELALWQARFVRALLQQRAGVDAEIVVIKTAGDRDELTPLGAMSGKAFFTKEIEDALLSGQVDLAVHSLKDLQTVMPDGLQLGAIPARADRRDLLLIRPETFDQSRLLRLRDQAKVGTSSSRRIAQLQFLRPDLQVEALRGNVPTRVRKLREGQYDAILVAAAGIDRLELDLGELVAFRLPESLIVPAPGQGALALQVRADDAPTRHVVAGLDDSSQQHTVEMEREILRQLGGGCQLALGTAAEETESGLRLTAFLGTDDPSRPRRIIVTGADGEAVVGAVVNYLRGTPILRSTDRRPRVWITREPARSDVFTKSLSPDRFEVSPIPVFVAVEAGSADEQRRAIESLDSYDWVFFTSQITVEQFAWLMEKYGGRFATQTRLAAVGRKTQTAMRQLGWRVDFVGDVADATAMAEQFDAEKTGPIGRILFPCGKAAGDGPDTALAEGCTAFHRLVCYDTVENPSLATTVANLPDPDAVVFTSPQTVRFLMERRVLSPQTVVVAIGPATTEALRAHGFGVVFEAIDRSLEGTAEVMNGLFPAPTAQAAASVGARA